MAWGRSTGSDNQARISVEMPHEQLWQVCTCASNDKYSFTAATRPAATIRCIPTERTLKCEKMCLLRSMKLAIKIYSYFSKRMDYILRKLFVDYWKTVLRPISEKVHSEFLALLKNLTLSPVRVCWRIRGFQRWESALGEDNCSCDVFYISWKCFPLK